MTSNLFPPKRLSTVGSAFPSATVPVAGSGGVSPPCANAGRGRPANPQAGRLRYRSQTAGSFFDASPYVCETTNPLACEV